MTVVTLHNTIPHGGAPQQSLAMLHVATAKINLLLLCNEIKLHIFVC